MEIIGLLFGLAFLFGVAAFAGLALFLAMRFLPWHPKFSARVPLAGGKLPTLILLYLLVCFGLSVAFGRATLFGDIEEELPNGYVLTALGKMPHCGYVGRKGGPVALGCVGEIAVHADRVAGKYDATHVPCDMQPPRAKPYFVLNSRTGISNEFATREQMNAAFGGEAPLTPIDVYQSPLTLRGRAARVMWAVLIFLGPTWLILRFVQLCRRDRLQQQAFS